MKIGFVLDDSLDKPDGVQQYVLTLGEWLASQGHTVHYLVGQTTTNNPYIHSLSRNLRVRFNHNIMTIPLPASREPIKALLDTERFDVLHVQMPFSPQLASRIIKLSDPSTALVGTFHILPYGLASKYGTKLLSICQKGSLSRFDDILSVSPAAQQFAKQWYGIESKVISNVVNLQKYRAKHHRHNGLNVVFLGRLVSRKGCMQLIEAISLLPEQLRNQLSVYIGGKGPLERALARQAEKLSIRNHIFFMGFIEESDKASFLAQADIAIFPSLGGESFGIVLLEAMAAGAGAVLAGNNIGYHSVLGKIPISMFDPNYPRAIAERLELVLRDSDLRGRIHALQEKLVKQYDVHVVGPMIISTYQEAIAKRKDKLHNT